MQPQRSAGLRPRAALLHLNECADAAVAPALAARAGHGTELVPRFDLSSVAGIEHPEALSADLRAQVAWDDRVDDVGRYAFATHWSLPTLRAHFASEDIATVVSDPLERILAYIEQARAWPTDRHRMWYPHTLPLDLCRAPLVEVLVMTQAADLIDNRIVRQVRRHDRRVVAGSFIAAEATETLALDTIASLGELGAVALWEQGPALWENLSNWLGVTVSENRGEPVRSRQMPGIFRRAAEVAAATDLLLERTRVDLRVWAHFARTYGVHDPMGRAVTAAEERLNDWCSSAFFAGFSDLDPSVEVTAQSPLGQALDGNVGPNAWLLTVDLDPDDHLSVLHRRITAVVSAGETPPAHHLVVAVDDDLVNLRDALVGHDPDAVVVGHRWVQRARPARLFAQLAELAAPGASLLAVAARSDLGALDRHVRSGGWGEIVHVPLLDGVAVRATNRAELHARTHYGIPFSLDDPDDSRAIVMSLCSGARSVLELGCSEGLGTKVMHDRGQHVVAVELDPTAAALARPFAEAVLVADLDDDTAFDPLLGRQFDAVLAADVLEHLRGPTAALRRALRHLAPGGNVVLSVPNLGHADVRLSLLDGRVPYKDLGLLDRTHVHWFTYDGFRQLLVDCELVVVEWRRTVFAPGTTEVALPTDLAELAQRWFADDPSATTYQWVVRCQRASEAVEQPDPHFVPGARRFVAEPRPGIRASGRALARAVTRKLRPKRS